MTAGPSSGDHLGPYDLRARVGEGASGTVFRAIDERSGETVAVKVLRSSLLRDRRALRRLAREARLAASLDHPALVRGRGLDRAGPWVFLVMDWVDGRSLAEVIRRDGPLGEVRAVRVLAWIASALAHTHARGIVHRDVKPGNILIGSHGRPMLSDLGLAKAPREREVAGGQTTLGTPHYMAPEQILDARHVDARSDLYALGATMYHACVGEPPFPGKDTAAVLSQHLHVPPVPPRRRRPGLSPAFSDLILRLLAKDPAARMPSAAALLRSLERWDPEGAMLRELPPPLPRRRVGRVVGICGLAAAGVAVLALAGRLLAPGESASPRAGGEASLAAPRRPREEASVAGRRGAPRSLGAGLGPLAPTAADARRDADLLRLETLAALLSADPPPLLDDCVLAFGDAFRDKLEQVWIRTFAAPGRQEAWPEEVRRSVDLAARRGLGDVLRWFEEVEQENLRGAGVPAIRAAMAAKDYGSALVALTRSRVRLQSIAALGRERRLGVDPPLESLALLRSLDEELRQAARADRLAVLALLEEEARRFLERGESPPGSPSPQAVERWLRGRVEQTLGLRIEVWPRELGDLQEDVSHTASRILGSSAKRGETSSRRYGHGQGQGLGHGGRGGGDASPRHT